MKMHPTFYVSRLKRYHGPQGPAAPQTPQASREEDPTPRNETQPQTSSNVQQRKAKTHATLVDREAAGTPEGSRAVEPQLGKPSTHHSPTADRTRKTSSTSDEGHPATNPIMDFRDLPAQLVHAVLKLREDPSISGLDGRITASPETQSDLEGQERVDGDDQPPRSATESQSQAVHSAERSAPQELPRTRSQTRAPPPILDRNGVTHYHVERVVRERHLHGKHQLLVKWRGYPDSQNSWEPI
ncbi:hypothetical protein PC129_g8029 [Phytophthora cactorum]|uniref:Chromo domain-containing protein n=1 Tax=Phytophthora cactorum TaxID=29920 RepID=A0A8T1IA54_9STRA|nr:hypothetical protein PC129_g8029 [Phytophthora cactorum]